MSNEELGARLGRLEKDLAELSDSFTQRLLKIEQRLDQLDKTVEHALSNAEYAAVHVKHLEH